jgi:hypothetical protein
MRQCKPFLIFCLLMALLFAPISARALDGPLMKGRALQLLCTSSKTDDLFSCQSYIAGIIDYHNLLKSLGAAPSVDFCVPQAVTMSQLKQVVTIYIAAHTEHQDFIASPGVVMALYNAYPCGRARR